MIAQNPGVNITAGNKDLEGTPWQSQLMAGDPYIFRTPGLAPINPADFPSLPGSIPPSLDLLRQPEGFTSHNPLPSYGQPGFPAIDPRSQGLGQLPPTTAIPQDPLVLRFDPMIGTPLPFYGNPLHESKSESAASGSSLAQDALPWLVGAAALGVAAPFVPAWLAVIAGIAAISRAANAHNLEPGVKSAVTDGGGVLSTGGPAYNAFDNDSITGNGTSSGGYSASLTFGPPPAVPPDQGATRATTFADRFGNWPETPSEVPSGAREVSTASAATAIPPEDVRRLTRMNASNAGNAFASGASPIPYLPSSEFNDRFGNWSVPTDEARPQQTSRPIGAFADEPSYLIPPPIWGLDDQGKTRNDADEWFSRWIQPRLRQE